MDKKIESRKRGLEYALTETDKLIDMFADVLKNTEAVEHEKRDFTPVVNKILGINQTPVGLFEEIPKTKPESKDERYSMDLKRLEDCSHQCTRCKLASTRKNVVFGMGCSDRPDVMIIGEGPGENEDETGKPFVGKAGQYLDSWLRAISLSREKNTYIANIIKCRPPMNRDPQPDEKTACHPFIEQQIALIRPRAILCLGKPASCEITGLENASMASLRGRFYFYDSIPVMCTYHPAAVLRDPSLKRPVWEDLKKLAGFLGIQVAGK